MLTRPKISRNPYYTNLVNLEGGKSGKIALCEGDDPCLVAKNFAISY